MNELATQMVGLVAAAGGGEHGELNWFVIGSMVTNFVLFFGFLYVKLKPGAKTALMERRTNMAKQLEEAQAKQREAEAKLAEYREKLSNLEAEVARVIKSYEAEAKNEAERMQAETARAIERLARDSDFTIKQEVRKAEDVIRTAAVKATMEAAEALIRERITDADRRRLVDQYISNLEQTAPPA